jgi:hypothetical protein
MAVTLDAVAGSAPTTTNTNTTSLSTLTIGTGNCLVAMLGVGSVATGAFTSASWGGQSLPTTPTLQVTNTGMINVWVLMNPTLGNQTLTFNWTNSTSVSTSLWAASFNSVASFTTNTATGTGVTASYSIGSAVGHLALDAASNAAGDWTSNGGAPQNQLILLSATNVRLASSDQVNQSTASFSWSTAGGSIPWQAAMFDFTPLPPSVNLESVIPLSSFRQQTVAVGY